MILLCCGRGGEVGRDKDVNHEVSAVSLMLEKLMELRAMQSLRSTHRLTAPLSRKDPPQWLVPVVPERMS